MVIESKQLADAMGAISKSITQGAGNRSGFLGELALEAYLGAERIDKFGYDLLLDGKKIEVKSKRRTVRPKDFYEGSVALTSGHQRPDYYAFLSLTFEEKRTISGKEYYCGLMDIWYCGIISYSSFINKAQLFKKGQKDDSNGFVVLADMYNIKYSELDLNI